MENMTIESLLQQVQSARVEYVWHMTEDQYKQAMKIHDADHNYIWQPGDYGQRGTVMGMKVVFVDQIEKPEVVAIVPDHVSVLRRQ